MSDQSPYAELLGLRSKRIDGATRFSMPFGDDVLGRPGFLHGGAIAGLLECAATAALNEALALQTKSGPRVRAEPIGMSIEFLRGGTAVDTHAAAIVRRLGKRIAHVEASAWQEDETVVIATARMNVLLVRD